MANQEHLDILKQGVEAWNQWRQVYPGIPTDLEYANLRFTNFRYADLSDANFLQANLSHADLLQANLSHADLSYANLSSVNLMFSDLHPLIDVSNLFAVFSRIDNILPSGANLSGAKLSNAIL